MDPITLCLAGGLIASAIGNWWQRNQVKDLQQQVAMLTEINKRLHEQLVACYAELEALRFWNVRKKAAYRKEIEALRQTVNWLAGVVERKNEEEMTNALKAFGNVVNG
jgi:uncharacterized protein with PIN domain